MFIRYPTRLHFLNTMVTSTQEFSDGIMIGVGDDDGHIILNTNSTSMIMVRNVNYYDNATWFPQLVIADSKESCNSQTSGLQLLTDTFNGFPRYGQNVLYSGEYDGFVYFPDSTADHEPIERKEISAAGKTVYAGDKFYTGVPSGPTWTSDQAMAAVKLNPRGALYNQSDAPEKWARWVWPRWVYKNGKFVPVDTSGTAKYIVGNPQWKFGGQTFTRVPNVTINDDGTFSQNGYNVLSSGGKYTVTYKSGYGYIIGGYGSSDGWWRCSSLTPEQDATFQFMTPEEYEGEQKENITLSWYDYVRDVGGPAKNVYLGEFSMWR